MSYSRAAAPNTRDSSPGPRDASRSQVEVLDLDAAARSFVADQRAVAPSHSTAGSPSLPRGAPVGSRAAPLDPQAPPLLNSQSPVEVINLDAGAPSLSVDQRAALDSHLISEVLQSAFEPSASSDLRGASPDPRDASSSSQSPVEVIDLDSGAPQLFADQRAAPHSQPRAQSVSDSSDPRSASSDPGDASPSSQSPVEVIDLDAGAPQLFAGQRAAPPSHPRARSPSQAAASPDSQGAPTGSLDDSPRSRSPVEVIDLDALAPTPLPPCQTAPASHQRAAPDSKAGSPDALATSLSYPVDASQSSRFVSSSSPRVATSSHRGGASLPHATGPLGRSRPPDDAQGQDLAARVVTRTDAPDAADDKKDMKSMMKEEGTRLLRPNAGKGPEVVQIGVFVKQFQRVVFVDKSFSADIVLTTRWVDNRTSKFLKKGAGSLSMRTKAARKLIWTPDISLLNRAPAGLDLISSVVRIEPDGFVEKIDRVHAILLHTYLTDAFPFDRQDLDIKVTTASTMSEQVVLKAIRELGVSGAAPDAFEQRQYKYVTHYTTSFEDTWGSISKSIVELRLVVDHYAGSTVAGTIWPCMAISSISWGANYIPCDHTACLMPRIALSFLCYLMQVVFADQVDNLQPERKNSSWLDTFQLALQTCVYCSVLFTIIIAYICTTLNLPKLGIHFDKELQILMPLITLLVCATCFTFTFFLSYVSVMAVIVAAIIYGFFLIYAISMVLRARRALKEGEGATKVAAPSLSVHQATSLSSPSKPTTLSAPPTTLSSPSVYTPAYPPDSRFDAPGHPEQRWTGYGAPLQSVTSFSQPAAAVPIKVENVGTQPSREVTIAAPLAQAETRAHYQQSMVSGPVTLAQTEYPAQASPSPSAISSVPFAQPAQEKSRPVAVQPPRAQAAYAMEPTASRPATPPVPSPQMGYPAASPLFKSTLGVPVGVEHLGQSPTQSPTSAFETETELDYSGVDPLQWGVQQGMPVGSLQQAPPVRYAAPPAVPVGQQPMPDGALLVRQGMPLGPQ